MGISAADRELLESNVGRAVVAAVRNSQKEPGTTIHPEMNLEIDLGLDSLARAETFAALEHAFATEFAAEETSTA